MSVTPDFIGQVYKDTLTGNIWRANSTTPGDWTLEVQNMQMNWEPKTLKLGEMAGVFTYGDLPGVTLLQFNGVGTLNGWDIENTEDLVTIDFPNLLTLDPGTIGYYGLYVRYNASLESINLPVLTAIGVDLDIRNNPLLTTIQIPTLSSVGRGIYVTNNVSLTSFLAPSLTTSTDYVICSGNTSLTTVVLTSYVPTDNSNAMFDNCALSEASVDHILERHVANAAYVSGVINLSGGTSSPPSATGLGYKTILEGRTSITVNVNS